MMASNTEKLRMFNAGNQRSL